MLHQITFQDLLSGKTFPEPSAETREKTSEQCFMPSAASGIGRNILFLDLRRESGRPQDASWVTVQALPGVSMMLNSGESPSEERESTLSQTLEVNVPEKYFLSARACNGILTRAKRRGKELPEMFMEALEEVVAIGA